jgi:hypothetical protein
MAINTSALKDWNVSSIQSSIAMIGEDKSNGSKTMKILSQN